MKWNIEAATRSAKQSKSKSKQIYGKCDSHGRLALERIVLNALGRSETRPMASLSPR
jgi:hypothetical protein